MVKSVNFVTIKDPREVQPLGIKAKKFYIYQLKILHQVLVDL